MDRTKKLMNKTLLYLILLFMFGTMNAYTSLDHLIDSNPMVSMENPSHYFQDKSFTISPNPSTNKLNIRLPKSSQDMMLEVFDVLGKRVYKSTITQLESSIDIASWKSGVYLVKISNEKESQTKRFIKH